MPWTTLCDLDELTEGKGRFVDIDGRELAVFLHEGKPFVTSNECPHAGGPMSQGSVEDNAGTPCAVCPWHGWPFRLDNGEYFDMPGFELPVYPARVETMGDRKLVQADLPMP